MPKKSSRSKKPIITIRRKGVFVCSNLVPKNQCGRPGQNTFEFAIEIEVDSLDEKGFVCDNFDVPQAFQKWNSPKEKWRASCEEFAGGGIHLMHSLCSRARRILCTIAPTNEANVTVEWFKGNPLPPFQPTKVA